LCRQSDHQCISWWISVILDLIIKLTTNHAVVVMAQLNEPYWHDCVGVTQHSALSLFWQNLTYFSAILLLTLTFCAIIVLLILTYHAVIVLSQLNFLFCHCVANLKAACLQIHVNLHNFFGNDFKSIIMWGEQLK
jgi:hypothetical protein